jgi:Xaa-Pro dipeptidase
MKILELEEYKENFEIDSIHYDSDLLDFVKQQEPAMLFINGEGKNSYSGKGPICPKFDWFSDYQINTADLYNVINETKVIKTEEEVDLMRNTAKVASNAHVFVMKNIKPGMTETHMQTLFRVLFPCF